MSGTVTMSPIAGNFVLDGRLSRGTLDLSEAHARLDKSACEIEIVARRFRSDEIILRGEVAANGCTMEDARARLAGEMSRVAASCGVDFNAEGVRVEQRVIAPVPAPDFSKSVNQKDFVAWRRQQRDHPEAGQPVWVGEYHVRADGGQVLRTLYGQHGAEVAYIELIERDGRELNVYKSNHEDPGNGLGAFMQHAQASAAVQGIEKRQEADAAARQEKSLDDVRRMAETDARPPGTVDVEDDTVTVNGVRVPRRK